MCTVETVFFTRDYQVSYLKCSYYVTFEVSKTFFLLENNFCIVD